LGLLYLLAILTRFPLFQYLIVLELLFIVGIGFMVSRWLLSEGSRKDGIFMAIFSVAFFLSAVFGILGSIYANAVLMAFVFVFLMVAGDYIESLVERVVLKRPSSVDILGVRIDNGNSDTAIARVNKMLQEEKFHYIVTPYSEFIVSANNNPKFMKILQSADLSIPDGIFTLLGASYLYLPISSFSISRFFQALLQLFFSGMCVLLYPEYTRMVIRDRVSGSEFIYPLCDFAAKEGYSMFLLGGQDWGKGNSGQLASKILKKKYPELKISGVYPGERKKENLDEALKIINKSHTDILVVCLGKKAELWIYENRKALNARVAIGLGGTLDFISGMTRKPSDAVNRLGLEWFFRQFGKQHGGLPGVARRMYRIWHGVTISTIMLLRWKIKYGSNIDRWQ
jgi:N-acetylglucosaminyldiphosphoundecaprenol N-acetyl-beta-D-mannosaminyltransferase